MGSFPLGLLFLFESAGLAEEVELIEEEQEVWSREIVAMT